MGRKLVFPCPCDDDQYIRQGGPTNTTDSDFFPDSLDGSLKKFDRFQSEKEECNTRASCGADGPANMEVTLRNKATLYSFSDTGGINGGYGNWKKWGGIYQDHRRLEPEHDATLFPETQQNFFK